MTPLDEAVRILRAGGLVAFPTETVYGLGADASNRDAVRKIFTAKGRPADHPLIVHLASVDQLTQWARDIPAYAYQLAEKCWPGPMTLILKRQPGVIDEVTGGQDSVGLRIPSHPLAQALLRAFRGGVAGPSANRFGRISPTTAAHVKAELGEDVDFILDGGACDVGIESTIVDCTGAAPVILRPGRITAEEVEAATHLALQSPTDSAPRVSGSLASHYAPVTPVMLVSSTGLAQALRDAPKPVAVLALQPEPAGWGDGPWIRASDSAEQYAHDLYAQLRDLDQRNCSAIIVENVPEGSRWSGIADRLGRAAGPS